MNPRKQILWTAVLLAVAANGFILWRKSLTPYEPGPGDPRRQIERVVQWESLPVVMLNQSPEEVKAVIADYPRDSCPDNPDVPKVPFVELSSAQKKDLFGTAAALLQCYQKSSPTMLVSYMEGRNERFNSEIMDRVKAEKVSLGLITNEELTSISDKEFILKVWGWKKCNSYWKSIVEKAGHVCLWRCRDPDEALKNLLGTTDRRIFRNVTNYTHLFRPDVSFQDACMQSGGVLVADIGVVIQHDDILRMERSPYFFRFWYSEHDQLWHPLSMTQVSTSYGSAGPTVAVLF